MADKVTPETTLVFDNGGGDLKAGHATDTSPKYLPNCTAKSRTERKFFVGDGIWQCRDLPSLYIRRAFDRGYLINWDVQADVWTRAMCKDVLNVSPADRSLLVTEPLLNPTELRDNMDEFVFEEFGFKSYCSTSAPVLAYMQHKKAHPESSFARTGCGVIVDVGFSFTHIVPMCDGKPLLASTKRIDLGGKALTNLLKEVISYRQWNMMDELFLVNAVKERLCFVARDFDQELADAKRLARVKDPGSIVREYVLPTGVIAGEDSVGTVRPLDAGPPKKDDHILTMNNERITVPEALFHPSNIGLMQMGVAEAVVASIEQSPEALHAAFYGGIHIVGGTAQLPHFATRLFSEVRQHAPDTYTVGVTIGEKPSSSVWEGGCAMANDASFAASCVTKAEYQEKGKAYCRQKLHQP